MNTLHRNRPVVLAIDDEAEVLAEIAQALIPQGFECRTCQDAQSAIALARQIVPDLIISDINIAGHSGLDLCEAMKCEQGLFDVPVVFLSGAQIPDVVRRAREAGGTYYLRKPFDAQVLLELVDKALWMPHLVKQQLAV
jgi:CheY-like chemotaxis protein